MSEIKRLAHLQGKAPGAELSSRETGIARHQWLGVHWARWSDAIKEAGLSSNSMNERLDSDIVLKKLADVCLRLGTLPPKAELKLIRRSDPTFPHDETFSRHFGGKGGVIEALRQLAASDPEYAMLLSWLPETQQPRTPASKTTQLGWVYLLKSGPHYKIGRSETIERRIKEIAVSLPETVELVHAIETDDPSGIESYWHKRFAGRRMNGEWFALSADEIRAFRRRKFQ